MAETAIGSSISLVLMSPVARCQPYEKKATTCSREASQRTKR